MHVMGVEEINNICSGICYHWVVSKILCQNDVGLDPTIGERKAVASTVSKKCVQGVNAVV